MQWTKVLVHLVLHLAGSVRVQLTASRGAISAWLHMSRNQMIALAAAVIVVLAIIGWAVIRSGGEQATSQPPPPAPSQQQTPPQPQQP